MTARLNGVGPVDNTRRRAYERQMSGLADLVRASRSEGFIRPDVPLAWVTASIDGLIWAACRAVGEGELGRVQAQDLVWETITSGLSTSAAEEF